MGPGIIKVIVLRLQYGNARVACFCVMAKSLSINVLELSTMEWINLPCLEDGENWVDGPVGKGF